MPAQLERPNPGAYDAAQPPRAFLAGAVVAIRAEGVRIVGFFCPSAPYASYFFVGPTAPYFFNFGWMIFCTIFPLVLSRIFGVFLHRGLDRGGGGNFDLR